MQRIIALVTSIILISINSAATASSNDDHSLQGYSPIVADYQLLTVPARDGEISLRMADPDAASQLAYRFEPDNNSLLGPVLIDDRVRYRLRKHSDPDLIASRYNLNDVSSQFSAQQIYTTSTGSVRSAVELAELLNHDPNIIHAYLLIPPVVRAMSINDPLFPDQWHLENTIEGDEIIDANVPPAWSLGFTGATGGNPNDLNEPVIVCTVDDGLDTEHEDLADAYRPDLSHDFTDDTDDPSHKFSFEAHGTAVSGVMAARGNSLGVRGVAFETELCALRMLDGPLSVDDFYDFFTWRTDVIDIKNNSWGRAQEQRVSHLFAEAQLGLEEGVTLGRDGLGEIYCFAAGNGFTVDGRADYGGINSSRYTITVAAVADNDIRSWYSARGSSLLVAAHSNGGSRGITTCDASGSDGYNSGDYTNSFGGTSSATPLVSGVVALMLNANPNLTWRDVQQILIRSVRKNDPDGENGDSPWETNAAGHDISYSYGFGTVDAEAAVRLAQTWAQAGIHSASPDEIREVALDTPTVIPAGDSPLTVPVMIDLPDSDCEADFPPIEHVELIITTSGGNRGKLEISITSPGGTESLFAKARTDPDNYEGYIFTSTRHWDECPEGEWLINLRDAEGGDDTQFVENLELVIHTGGVEGRFPGDVDGDGDVDQADLGILLATYNLNPDDPLFDSRADFNGDGFVDQSDLGILLAHYGEES